MPTRLCSGQQGQEEQDWRYKNTAINLPKYLNVATRNERSGNATSTARIKSAEAQLDKRIHEFWAADIAENISIVRNNLLNSKLPGEFVLSLMHDELMLNQFTKSRQCQRTRRYDE